MNPCERNGVDQGMHNYFLYSGRVQGAIEEAAGAGNGASGSGGAKPAVRIITNEDGWIATVQSMPTLHRDRGGRVMNGAGSAVAAVVHQYDRSGLLKDQYEREFVLLGPNERTGK